MNCCCFIFFFQGCTETGGVVTVTPISSKPCTCGKVSVNVQLKIINPVNGDILGPNEEGEICVKTSRMMIGYYKNQEATAQVIDSDGKLIYNFLLILNKK